MRNGHSRWVAAEVALNHYVKYQSPIGKLLRSSLIAYARELHLSANVVKGLIEYSTHIQQLRITAPDAIVDKIITYKRERMRATALQQMTELQSVGELSDEKWREITEAVLVKKNGAQKAVEFFSDAEVENRIARRALRERSTHTPFLFIDPIDMRVRALARGQIGTILAPPERGKSMMLSWIAVAYTLQRLNVLVVTLEDPRSEYDDRIDAAVTGIRVDRLSENPDLYRRRFNKFKRLVHTHLRIIDATDPDGDSAGVTVLDLEKFIMRERDQGFITDALIVDYDDEIAPTRKHAGDSSRRFEFADIYRDLRRLAAKYNLFLWTAAQTQRNTSHLRILTGDKLAEDYSKIRKVRMALSLGQGDWGDESIYLYVAKHNYGKSRFGANILTDREHMLIYDREATRKRQLDEDRARDEEQ